MSEQTDMTVEGAYEALRRLSPSIAWFYEAEFRAILDCLDASAYERGFQHARELSPGELSKRDYSL